MVFDPEEYREFRRVERELSEQALGTGTGEKVAWKSPPIAPKPSARARQQEGHREKSPHELEERTADGVTYSSTWTGRRSAAEQLAVIKAYGPIAVEGTESLIAALQSARLNDPEAEKVLGSLRELHAALGELIATVEARRPARTAWQMFERKKGKLVETIGNGVQVFAVAPVIAFGVATVLSLISGEKITGEMLAILSGAVLAKDAVWRARRTGPNSRADARVTQQ